MLGTRPALGRGFAEGEDTAGAGVAVLGHGLWQQLYGGDPSAIGATIRVNGAPLTVVGDCAAGVRLSAGHRPLVVDGFDYQRVPRTGVVLVRGRRACKGGTDLGAGAAGVRGRGVRRTGRRAAPRRPEPSGARAPARASWRARYGQASFVLMAGVALLLAARVRRTSPTSCSGARSRANRSSMIRTALGASRARLTQQLLTEAVAAVGRRRRRGAGRGAGGRRGAATRVQPAQLASQAYSVLDWQVLTFSMVLSIGSCRRISGSSPGSGRCQF